MALPRCEQPRSADGACDTAADTLDAALTAPLIGREREWADGAVAALDRVTAALRAEMAAGHTCGGRRQDQFRLLEQTCAVRRRIQQILQAFASPPYHAFAAAIQDGQQLVQALRRQGADAAQPDTAAEIDLDTLIA